MSDIKIDDKWLHRHGAYDTKNCHVNGWPDTGDEDYPTYPYDVYDCMGHEGTYDEETHRATINEIIYVLDLDNKTCVTPEDKYQDGSSGLIPTDDGVLVLDWIVVYGERYFLTTIGLGSFMNNGNIKSLIFGDGVTTIEEMAFEGCGGIENLVIPDTVLEMGESAFSCGSGNSLKSIVIGDGVTSLANSLFGIQNVLETVVLGTNIQSMSHRVFLDCHPFTLYYRGTEEQWNAIEKDERWADECDVTMVYNYTD